ncbi:39S ribosomal protein L28, mitochondrial [Fopius arisanus]|uniref:39S ribosomal protein L28, mitochondrial n=1 Tax=Fopius arisanus TaxID=64838 RepID=A0A9R1U034_9HYME|nr:PREDICTED: 39S ribosomal protein L28, mitochondrial [Fopius arisanus]
MPVTKLPNRLYYFPKPNRWQKGIGSELPEAYKKFWHEWKLRTPTAVHYIPEEGKYKWDEHQQTVLPVQNIPLPLRFPKEQDYGIWGGEAIVQGYRKKGKYRMKVAKFWVPTLRRSVVYSEILDTHMKTTITMRTIDLIHEHYGFDHYLLKTPACDLKSLLAVKLKREILIALADKTLYPHDPEKREEVYNKYKDYLSAYTREEIEWYGLSYKDAVKKWIAIKEPLEKPEPFKIRYRSELIAELKAAKIAEAMDADVERPSESWIAKINPFSKTPKTE